MHNVRRRERILTVVPKRPMWSPGYVSVLSPLGCHCHDPVSARGEWRLHLL